MGNQRNNNGNRNNNHNNNSDKPKKHSGAKSGMGKNGNPYIRGWNYSKRHGMRVFLCTPYNGTGEHESNNGRTWMNWMCTIQQQGVKPIIVSCLIDKSTNRAIIKDLQMVVNPSKNYCGTYVRSKN